MTLNDDNIAFIGDYLKEKAESLARVRTGTRVVSLILVTTASFTDERHLELILALLSELSGVFLEVWAKRLWATHRRIRGQGLVANSYGEPLVFPRSYLAGAISLTTMERLLALRRPPESPYYSSTETLGDRRLVDNVRESAFYTSQLLKEYSSALLWAPAMIGALLSLSIFISPYVGTDSPVTDVLLLALTGLSLLDGVRDHFNANFYSSEIAMVHEACCRSLVQKEFDQRQSMILYSDYVILSQAAPAIPMKLFAARGRQLKNQLAS